jgi:hypothetical protein
LFLRQAEIQATDIGIFTKVHEKWVHPEKVVNVPVAGHKATLRSIRRDYASVLLDTGILVLVQLHTLIEHGVRLTSRWDLLQEAGDEFGPSDDLDF